MRPAHVVVSSIAFALSSFPVCANSASPRLTLEQVRVRALAASGASTETGGWMATGDCTVHGATENFEFDFKGAEFVDASKGILNDIAGYDGKNCWVENWAGIPHYVSLTEKDENVLIGLILSGAWADGEAPFDITTTASSASDPTLLIRLKGGQLNATLALDRETYLPKTLKYWTESGDETWTFAGYRSFHGRKLPIGIYHSMTQQTDIYSIHSARPAGLGQEHFAMPSPDLGATRYDADGPQTVPLKVAGGYMFVHPLINGQDLGWFFLDSGAEVMCIDTAVAQQENLKEIGKDITAGVVAVTHLPICRASRFQLGPVSFENPTFYELDMRSFGDAVGFKIAGICGFDFLGRADLDIDPSTKQITIFSPSEARWPSEPNWSHFIFNGETPCVECDFEGGHRGLFSLDTGSDSNVDFFSPIVRRLNMLKGRSLQNMQTGGAGGNSESKEAQISYFQIGGHRFSDPSVGLQITKQGVYASPFLDGNVGMGFLGKFRLLFDYSNSRIGFVTPS